MLEICKERWSADQVVSLLSCDNRDARKVAALALSLAGCQHCLEPLARALKDRDPMVNQMAEHAMWSIWFRGGATPEANHQLARGAMAMERKDIAHAITHFDHAIQIDPNFSEAYNQRAIAQFMLERYDDSLGPRLLIGWRFAIAGVLWLAIFPAARRGWSWRSVGRAIALGTLFAAAMVAQQMGLDRTTEAVSAFLTSLSILFVPLLMMLI